MKTFLAVLLLSLLMGCATADNGKGTDPQIKFGGSMRTTIESRSGM